MDAPVQLVFRGELHAGFHLDEVKRSLGQLLKLDDARLAQMFSGARTVLKRSLQAHEAQRYVEHLARLGARIHIEPMQAPVAAPAAPAAVAPAPATPARPPALALVPEAAAATEEEIVCPTCNERQSKRILCRSCATNMPMGIAAKLEAEQEARAARQALIDARRRPARTREAEDVVEADPDAPTVWGVGFNGRMARLPYATANTWLVTLLVVLTFHLLQRPTGGRFVLVALGGIAFFVLSMRLAVLRCHDCDRHGWWAMILLVPYAGSVASLVLSFMPGTRGDNEFGGPARRGRWLWLLVAMIALGGSIAWGVRTTMHSFERQAAEASATQDEFAEDELAAVLQPEAAQAFRNDYLLSPRHKAFAASPGGAWGFKSGASSMQDAVRSAMSECDARRQAYTPKCELINVNGQWATGPK